MASTITYEHLNHVHKKAEGFKKRLEAYKEKLEGATTKIVRTLEVGFGAAAAGLIQGKWNHPHFAHVPIDLGLGLALNLAGYLEAAGSASDHLCNIGDGFVAAYTSGLGYQMGQNLAAGKGWLGHGGKAPAQIPAPVAAAVAAGAIDPAQMAAVLAAMQQGRAG